MGLKIGLLIGGLLLLFFFFGQRVGIGVAGLAVDLHPVGFVHLGDLPGCTGLGLGDGAFRGPGFFRER